MTLEFEAQVGRLGERGQPGAQIIELGSPPGTEDGNDGDWALVKGPGDDTMLYGPKVEGEWPAGRSVRGAQGPSGPQGPQGEKGEIGPQGAVGPQGAAGYRGWNPVLVPVEVEVDEETVILFQLIDWIGGQGDKPSVFVGQYAKVDGSGYTSDTSEALDVSEYRVDPNWIAKAVPLPMAKAPPEISRTDANTLTIAAGRFRDEDDSINIELPSSLTLTTSGLSADTWYHILAGLDGNGDPAATAATSIALPSGWQAYRRIGSWRTDGDTEWERWVQIGNRFDRLIAQQDASLSSISTSTTGTLVALPMPESVWVEAIVLTTLTSVDNSGQLLVTSSDSEALPDNAHYTHRFLEGSGNRNSLETRIMSQNGQVRVVRAGDNPSAELSLSLIGYIDRRGRDK